MGRTAAEVVGLIVYYPQEKMSRRVVIVSLSGVTTWERQEMEDQETKENALNSHHYHANETSVTMQPWLQETPVTFLINLPH